MLRENRFVSSLLVTATILIAFSLSGFAFDLTSGWAVVICALGTPVLGGFFFGSTKIFWLHSLVIVLVVSLIWSTPDIWNLIVRQPAPGGGVLQGLVLAGLCVLLFALGVLVRSSVLRIIRRRAA